MATPNPSPAFLEEYSGSKLLAVAISFTVLEVVIVGLRYLSRYLKKAPLGLDDWLILPSLVFCIATNAIAISMVQYGGVGYHFDRVYAEWPDKIIVWSKFLLAEPVTYEIALTLPKLAILSLYLRIFTERKFRYATYAIGLVIILSAIIEIFICIFQCVPVAKFWDTTLPGVCNINTNALFRYSSIPNILTDVAMLILPMPVIWKLQTTRHNKIGLTFTFLTGSIGLVFNIVRCVNFFVIDPTLDGTWSSVDLVIWSVIEPGMYVAAACLPACRPLLGYMRRALGFKSLISRGYGSGNKNGGDKFTGGSKRSNANGTIDDDIPILSAKEKGRGGVGKFFRLPDAADNFFGGRRNSQESDHTLVDMQGRDSSSSAGNTAKVSAPIPTYNTLSMVERGENGRSLQSHVPARGGGAYGRQQQQHQNRNLPPLPRDQQQEYRYGIGAGIHVQQDYGVRSDSH